MRIVALLLLMPAIFPLDAVAAQGIASDSGAPADVSAERFVAATRAGTVRYSSRAVAIADGYHRVGPELPSMGEHWLNIGLILADRVDAAHPPVLIYVASPTGPVLAGVAYTRMLGPHDDYPDFPRGQRAWHAHSGFLDDESLPMSHAAHDMNADHDMPNGTRLGILHLWTGVVNPAGEWVADNWALPFVRAGVGLPARSSPVAARSLALLPDSGRYYLDVLTAVGRLDSAEVNDVRAILASASSQVRGLGLTGRTALSPGELAALELVWRTLWPNIEAKLTPESRDRVEELKQSWW